MGLKNAKCLVYMCTSISLALLQGSASAQTLSFYWGADGQHRGGTGAWNLTDKNWENSRTEMFQAWSNDDTNAIFEGKAGTVNVSDNITVGNLTFKVDGYTLANTAKNKLTFANFFNNI